jgi:hypothetical protein
MAPETDNDVFFFVSEVGFPFTLAGATVNLTGPNGYNETITTGNPIGDLFENVPYGDYNYTISLDCYETVSGSVTSECIGGGQGVSVFAEMAPETDNDVFFFVSEVGFPFTLAGATVNLTGPNGYNETITTGNPIGDLFENVPYGDYNYTISLDCYETVSGSVTSECIGGGQGVSVFAEMTPETTENVFFFVGFPLPVSGATVNLVGPNGYDETIISGNPVGDVFENVPYGEYTYTVEGQCSDVITGFVMVECVPGPQSVEVFVNLEDSTDNDVIFFVGDPEVIDGLSVQLTGSNGFDQTIVTGNAQGDYFFDVPFGEYTYTISGNCAETITGSLIVECTPDLPAIPVFENPSITELDTTVTQEGNTLTAQVTGVSYQWIDCDTGEPIEGADQQSYEVTADGTYAVIITDGNCSQQSECIDVTLLGVQDYALEGITFYPNPTTDRVNFDLPFTLDQGQLMLYDLSGQLIERISFEATDKLELNMSRYATGIYLVQIESQGRLFTAKLVRE